ncbi:MAG: NYN domain-containing protein [Promethearchaeota archaeon]
MEKLGIIPNRPKRVIIFVDHANIFYNLQKRDIRIDYQKLRQIVSRDSHLVGAFVYLGVPDKIPIEKENFMRYIEKAGYTIQKRPLSMLSDGSTKQKRIDIFIYKDMVELAEEDAYDKAVLLSGDGDFVDAIKQLKVLKKRFEIWSFCKSLSKLLRKEAGEDNIHYIDDILGEISQKKKEEE